MDRIRNGLLIKDDESISYVESELTKTEDDNSPHVHAEELFEGYALPPANHIHEDETQLVYFDPPLFVGPTQLESIYEGYAFTTERDLIVFYSQDEDAAVIDLRTREHALRQNTIVMKFYNNFPKFTRHFIKIWQNKEDDGDKWYYARSLYHHLLEYRRKFMRSSADDRVRVIHSSAMKKLADYFAQSHAFFTRQEWYDENIVSDMITQDVEISTTGDILCDNLSVLEEYMKLPNAPILYIYLLSFEYAVCLERIRDERMRLRDIYGEKTVTIYLEKSTVL
jgi:hypothetical protein